MSDDELEGEDPAIGAVVGNLKLVSLIGVGGMGVVYRAEHPSLPMPYAVKLLNHEFTQDVETLERFRQEAVACSRLRHANVVFITDFGFHEKLGIYIAMEFLQGLTVEELLDESKTLEIGLTVHLIKQVCEALAAAHRLNIIHRDLKPDNLFLVRDKTRSNFIKVLDFGIAHVLNGGEGNEEGVLLGTPSYMAPEQILDDELGPHTDIYALGGILYALLAGEPPFKGKNNYEIFGHQVRTPAPLVSTARPELKDSLLEKLISDMLAKAPADRPYDMDDVKARLEVALEELRGLELEGVEYIPPTDHSENPDLDRAHKVNRKTNFNTLRVTGVFKEIRAAHPNSPVGTLLSMLPVVDEVRGQALCMAVWGMLQQELRDPVAEEEDIIIACMQMKLLIQGVLDSYQGVEPSASQDRIFRYLRQLMDNLEDERKLHLGVALHSLSSHPFFPMDILPSKLIGNWSAAKQLTDEELMALSLTDKLKQDVSLRSIKALLNHEIRLFGRRTKPI